MPTTLTLTVELEDEVVALLDTQATGAYRTRKLHAEYLTKIALTRELIRKAKPVRPVQKTRRVTVETDAETNGAGVRVD